MKKTQSHKDYCIVFSFPILITENSFSDRFMYIQLDKITWGKYERMTNPLKYIFSMLKLNTRRSLSISSYPTNERNRWNPSASRYNRLLKLLLYYLENSISNRTICPSKPRIVAITKNRKLRIRQTKSNIFLTKKVRPTVKTIVKTHVRLTDIVATKKI